MAKSTHFKGPVDSKGGFTVNGTTVITSAGAITADIQATTGSIGTAELAAQAVSMAKLARGTNGQIIVANTGADAAYVAVSGDATLAANGALTIANDAVTSAKIAPSVIQEVTVTLTPTTIVGTDAGDLGHSAGVELVAAEAGKIHEFISAVLSYDFGTAAYTGGGDDVVIRNGTTAVSAVIAKADLLADTEDDIAYVGALSAADIKLTANSALNIFAGTAYTQPGTAAGTCKVHVLYRTVAV